MSMFIKNISENNLIIYKNKIKFLRCEKDRCFNLSLLKENFLLNNHVKFNKLFFFIFCWKIFLYLYKNFFLIFLKVLKMNKFLFFKKKKLFIFKKFKDDLLYSIKKKKRKYKKKNIYYPSFYKIYRGKKRFFNKRFNFVLKRIKQIRFFKNRSLKKKYFFFFFNGSMVKKDKFRTVKKFLFLKKKRKHRLLRRIRKRDLKKLKSINSVFFRHKKIKKKNKNKIYYLFLVKYVLFKNFKPTENKKYSKKIHFFSRNEYLKSKKKGFKKKKFSPKNYIKNYYKKLNFKNFHKKSFKRIYIRKWFDRIKNFEYPHKKGLIENLFYSYFYCLRQAKLKKYFINLNKKRYSSGYHKVILNISNVNLSLNKRNYFLKKKIKIIKIKNFLNRRIGKIRLNLKSHIFFLKSYFLKLFLFSFINLKFHNYFFFKYKICYIFEKIYFKFNAFFFRFYDSLSESISYYNNSNSLLNNNYYLNNNSYFNSYFSILELSKNFQKEKILLQNKNVLNDYVIDEESFIKEYLKNFKDKLISKKIDLDDVIFIKIMSSNKLERKNFSNLYFINIFKLFL